MYKILSVRFTEEEYNRIFEGVEKPSSYLKELASRSDSFASESKKVELEDDGSDGMDWLLKVIKKFESADDFMEKFIKYVGVSMPDKIFVLFNSVSDHPYAGYKVVEYVPDCRGWKLSHPRKPELILSDNIDGSASNCLYDDEMKPLFKVGDVIL